MILMTIRRHYRHVGIELVNLDHTIVQGVLRDSKDRYQHSDIDVAEHSCDLFVRHVITGECIQYQC